MKILLCIGIIILMGLIGVGVYMVCRIAAYQHLQTQMMVNVSQSVPPGGTGNGIGAFEGLHIWDEVPNCTLLMQCYFNSPEEFYIVDFSRFTEENRLVGLQLFDTRRVPEDMATTEPVVLNNITFRKISDAGDPEEESHWLWYFPEQESWN